MSVIERLGLDPRDFAWEDSACSEGQNQTKEAFGFKWAKRDTYESDSVKAASRQWLLERYCGNDPGQVAKWLAGGRKLILDAGCGAATSAMLLFGDLIKEHDYLGVDISDAVQVARTRFQESGYPGDFLQLDLMTLPVPDESLDLIFSEGVLHHTDNTEKALLFLARKLKAGGRFLFYVYAKKAVVREFTDDHVRKTIRDMTDEEAWEALKPLTRLGIALGELDVSIEVPEDIPPLGIPKGKMSLQRFFYWNICKLFYRPEYSFSEMHHVNFDWFRPLNCHRHTPEEIRQWCEDAHLSIQREVVEEAGITIVAVKGHRDEASHDDPPA